MRLIDQLELSRRRVFIRVDFNVPLRDGRVTDATRIAAAKPTIMHAIEHDARVILASHLGRPKGRRDPAFSLAPLLPVIGEVLGKSVDLAPDCVAQPAEDAVAALSPGGVLLLENLRFHPEEEKNDDGFSRSLAKLADVYVNDAFGAAHRAHASTVGMVRHVPQRAAGFLLERECQFLGKLLGNPDRPFLAILGGAKVSDKIKVIRSLLEKVNALLVGGAMAYTFLRAQGRSTGKSLVEEDQIPLATELIALAKARNVRLVLPTDHVVAESPKGSASTVRGDIPAGMMGLDVGPDTIRAFDEQVARARTIFWNGPLGMFETPPFDAGTMAMASALAGTSAMTVVGGGDSVAALMRSGKAASISHISTGGGASLEFLEGQGLPGLAALEDS